MRDLCGKLWESPERLASVRSHAVRDRFEIEPHQHRATLQFDLIDGCSGQAFGDGQWQAIEGLTLLVSYPGQLHGYRLREKAVPSRVYHVKLKVSSRWVAVRRQVWPMLVTRQRSEGWLVDAMRQLGDYQMLVEPAKMERLTAFSQVLCHWPRLASSLDDQQGGDSSDASMIVPPDTLPRGVARPFGPGALRGLEATSQIFYGGTSGGSGASGGGGSWGGDEAIRRAVDLVDERLHESLTVDDMAAAAHLSPRQFVRRFYQAIGRTPHDYLTARRLVRASELLLNPKLKVAGVAEQLGFSSTATFSRWFTQQTGDTPSVYRSDPRRM